MVGISEDFRSLIADHESIGRQLAEGTIKIGPMDSKMLVEILRRAETLLKDITFEEDVIGHIVEMSEGYPHWVHLLGKWACIDTVESDEKTVRMPSLWRGLERLVKQEPAHEDRYMRLTKGDKENELMLKVLSAEAQNLFNPDEGYRIAKSNGISFKSWIEFFDRLVSDDVLNRIESRFTSFKDVRFKIYSKIRPPLYPENDVRSITRDDLLLKIVFAVKEFELPQSVTTYLGNHDTAIFYYKASQFVPLVPDFSFQEKPILYDSKGNPLYTRDK